MPGLRNRATWAPLLLKSSRITSCANGCSLGITAHLTYANTESEPVEGLFVYPLGEREVVVGFEALVSGRLLSVELQSRGKLDDCCLDCCPGSAFNSQCGHSKEWTCCGGNSLDIQCCNGHLLLDEDLERTTFIIGTGLIAPMEMVSVVISTTLELPTLENGAIHLIYPTVLTPIVRARMQPTKSENGGRSEETNATRCFGVSGKQEKLLEVNEQCAHALFSSPATNLAPYELNFQLLVRGACLLAGLESPTHALRADAEPSAQSASATYITLAEDHPYDRHLEIILHLSEPHSPLVILERGRLTFSQYEQQISARRDFIRCVRKEAEPEKKLEFMRKRYHKDVLSNPVLMLNFCPDLSSEPLELQQASRELLFLIDHGANVTQHTINKIKEGMLVAVKSLPHGTMLNVVGFDSSVKPLFASSKPCTDSTLAQVLDYIQRLRADQGATDLLGALSWVYRQPVHRSCPRQLFILTDGSLGSVGRALELVRRNTCNARCFGLGLGPRACRRLLQGIAKMTGGNAEFHCEEERLQPKLIKCLKKALEPALTDVRIDWYVPDNMEALLSPNEIPPLYPGNRLIGYCTLYDVSAFKVKKNEVKSHGYRPAPRGSVGSVFELSPGSSELLQPLVPASEREAAEEGEIEDALREISQEISSEFSCAPATDNTSNSVTDQDYVVSDVRWRMEQASYVQEQYMLTRCSLSSERGLASFSSPSEGLSLSMDTGSLPQGLERVQPQGRGLSRWESPWQQTATSSVDTEPEKGVRLSDREECVRRQKALARCALASRSFSSPQGDLDMHRLRRALERVSFEQTVGGKLDENDIETHNTPQALSLTDSNGLLFPASPLDWDSFTDPEALFAPAPAGDSQAGQASCRSVIHGLLGARPVSWEVAVDLSMLWATESPPRGHWDEIIHQLTARSIIRDFENMAEKETDIEHGSSKRYRMKAIQTSKSCGIICMYTAFTTTDTSPKKTLSEATNSRYTGVRFGSRRSTSSRRQRTLSVGFGRRPSNRDSEEIDDIHTSTDRDNTPASPRSLASWDSSVGGNVYPGSPSAASSRSQRSIESRSVESFFTTRFNLGRLRSSHSSGRQTPLKPHCLSAESDTYTDSISPDYLPLVRLQLASGAFLLCESFSECIHIPLDRLKRASPYLSHRSSLSPPYRCISPPGTRPIAPYRPMDHTSTHQPHASLRRYYDNEPLTVFSDPEEGSPEPVGGILQADSGRGSETDMCEGSPLEGVDPHGEELAQLDVESSSWATALALAWLEHHCAGYFVEWELVAAKADFWLKCQSLPEGVDLPGLRAAARQLFLLLRHWDENLQLNMLCYNPNNM
ncbi:von Willebrand factor A domain-containing protein 5B2-like [Pygocentrus nattereri]|uniref:VWFA domain-containing protein n=1 Tax=Pygocentrus nattereri TaxID=42514 RepID=A0A3B4CYH0_PYGNA|nr:von Willebrand factor A domain-containing protein 5B2-like [Pygocentrus nattereri]XP_037386945.1 von Willebrand factor A domain-containing protein 5B2-like [Pygocentrus nattereri]